MYVNRGNERRKTGDGGRWRINRLCTLGLAAVGIGSSTFHISEFGECQRWEVIKYKYFVAPVDFTNICALLKFFFFECFFLIFVLMFVDKHKDYFCQEEILKPQADQRQPEFFISFFKSSSRHGTQTGRGRTSSDVKHRRSLADRKLPK